MKCPVCRDSIDLIHDARGCPLQKPYPKSEPKCGDCLFYLREEGPFDEGVCRRYPPISADEFKFPQTAGGGWCGEFKARRT